MRAPSENLLAWAAAHAPDRRTAVGVLALRVRHYFSDGAEPAPSSLPDLRVRVRGQAELPLWHASSGLYGFLRLPPGEARVEIDDPSGRYLPQAISAVVPDRRALRDALEAAAAPPAGPPPAYPQVALRPAPGFGLSPATCALWGVLREGSRAVPGALLSIATVRDGGPDTVSTLTARDGSYLIVLPGEVINRGVTPPQRRFDRALTVRTPRPALAAALASQGFLAALPADVFSLGAADRDALFAPRNFQLRDAAGLLHPQQAGQNPPASVSVGQSVRLDIELLP